MTHEVISETLPIQFLIGFFRAGVLHFCGTHDLEVGEDVIEARAIHAWLNSISNGLIFMMTPLNVRNVALAVTRGCSQKWKIIWHGKQKGFYWHAGLCYRIMCRRSSLNLIIFGKDIWRKSYSDSWCTW